MDFKPKYDVPHISRCVRLTSSYSAAIVIYRMKVWTPKIEIDGKLWFAKSYEEIMYETGLTRKVVQLAVSELKASGWIEARQCKFHGKNVNHYRVTETFLEKFDQLSHLG
jgi:hypothetical protein